MGRVAKKVIIGFNRRYNYPDGSFAGIISASTPLSYFNELLKQFNVGPSGAIVLRDAELGLITRFPELPDKPAGQFGNKAVSPELQKIIAAGIESTTYFTPKSADGFQRVISFKHLKKAKIYSLVGLASEDYLLDWHSEVTKTAALAFSYFLLSLILGGFIFRLLKKSEQNEFALAERELRLKTIIENEPECIKIVDASGRLIEMNPAGLVMIEADSLEDVVNQPVLGLVAPESKTAFSEMHQQVIAGQPARLEFAMVGLKGGRHWMETHAVPMRVND
jgi:PAS domain S-box-containing protein